MIKLIARADNFGTPIMLNYKGNSEYQTSCGGFFSLIMTILMLRFSLVKFLELYNYENQSITKSTLFENDTEFPTAEAFNLSLAFSIYNGSDFIPFDERYGSLEVFTLESENTTKYHQAKLDLISCDEQHLG